METELQRALSVGPAGSGLVVPLLLAQESWAWGSAGSLAFLCSAFLPLAAAAPAVTILDLAEEALCWVRPRTYCSTLEL